MKTFSAAHVKQYLADARRDMNILINAAIQPVSGKTAVGITGTAALVATVMNMSVVFAATPLFTRLSSAFTTLLNDAQDLVLTVATFALVVCLLGLMFAASFGAKETAMMVNALKAVILAFIFFQLLPVILATIMEVFGTGSTTEGE